MGKISINLLPGEIALLEKDKKKRSTLIKIGTSIVVGMIVLTSLVLSIRIIQNRTVDQATLDFKNSQNKVLALKDREAVVSVLKTRLTNIKNLTQQTSKQAQSYNLITALVPQSMDILTLTLSKTGTIELSTETNDVEVMSQFFNTLVDPQSTQGKISSVKIDSLSKAANSLYRMDLTITTI